MVVVEKTVKEIPFNAGTSTSISRRVKSVASGTLYPLQSAGRLTQQVRVRHVNAS